jgi:hypothetical protein
MKTFSQFIAEAKFEKHMSPDEKEDIRNQRAFGSTSLKNRATGMRRTFHAAERGIKKEIPTGNEKSEISGKYNTTGAELRREIRRLKGLKSGRDFSKRVKQELEADRYIKQQNSEFAAKNAQNKIVRTFREFIEISEKYYKPDEELPGSKKTPYRKAYDKERRREHNIGPNSNIERMRRHAHATETKVKHGADNPEYNGKVSPKDRDITVDSDYDYMTVHHKPSKITYNVTNVGDGIHTIEWQHGHGNKRNLSRQQRLKIANDAKKVWHQHVSHRLPYGDVAHNKPSSSRDEVTKQEKPVNRRANIYQRSGFGPTDSSNDQFAKIGREPSPRQRAKGKTRLKPIDPQEIKKEVGWDD